MKNAARFVVTVSTLLCMTDALGAAYQFERAWPTLPQPWYFNSPSGVAVTDTGQVFVADTANCRIGKFNTLGQFVTFWGTVGTGNGQFLRPEDVAVDSVGNAYVVDRFGGRVSKFTPAGDFVTAWDGSEGDAGPLAQPQGIGVDRTQFVYVADTGNDRIQVFDTNGIFLASFGGTGSGPGQFSEPRGLAVDAAGNLYVVDTGNNRVQKFSPERVFITQWGAGGNGLGQFDLPSKIAVGNNSYVYITDSENHRVQKFTDTGSFVAEWGDEGSKPGQFTNPDGIAVDKAGYVYVTDRGLNDRVEVFTSAGDLLAVWGSQSTRANEFGNPFSLAVDSAGFIYVVEALNLRIQKLTASGDFVEFWGPDEGEPGAWVRPNAIAIGPGDYVYVYDLDNKVIRKYTIDGTFVTQWGGEGFDDGQFLYFVRMCTDSDGNVYAVDTVNDRVQKFTADGAFLKSWGESGSEDGQFSAPYDIACDADDNVYVVDKDNDRIQKFDSNGSFLGKWGAPGTGEGQFEKPWAIGIDKAGRVYVTDDASDRIQVFSTNGDFVAAFGGSGINPGDFNRPTDVDSVEMDGVVVADYINNRLQVFRYKEQATRAKSVIVAGGGPYEGNYLWDATEACANFAYRALTYQGYSKDTICYLSSDLDLDLDGNGLADDVDAAPTRSNLAFAIATWAADADLLTVYLVDHGGDGVFRLSASEIITDGEMALLLDAAQNAIAGPVVLVYDACRSGSFIDALEPLACTVVASTATDESAYFLSGGAVSFSNFFWTDIFRGLSVGGAYQTASAAIGQSIAFQTPQLLDPNGDANTLYLGTGAPQDPDMPVITDYSPSQTVSAGSDAQLYAEVTDLAGLARVWAVVRPPDLVPPEPGKPVQEFPTVELQPVDADRWEATYTGFVTAGTYQVVLYARNVLGNTSTPALTTVSVDSPLRRRAVILAGGSETDATWPAYEKCYALAYTALRTQGFADDDIYLMAPSTVVPAVVHDPSLANLTFALGEWLGENTQDLVLYMVGPGAEEIFEISPEETLDAEDLGELLDGAQARVTRNVTFVYDACAAGSFLPHVRPSGGERVVITGCREAESAVFVAESDLSFSSFFWSAVMNGGTLEQAFISAAASIAFSGDGQTALRDDNGNGVANEPEDGRISARRYLGAGIVLAADAPIIGEVVESQTLDGTTLATIWAGDISTSGVLDAVWAAITPPAAEKSTDTKSTDRKSTDRKSTDRKSTDCNPIIPTLLLQASGEGRYSGDYSHFDDAGVYQVAVFARDTEGNVSLAKETSVTQLVPVDIDPPALESVSPADGSAGVARRPQIQLALTDNKSGIDPGSIRLLVNDENVSADTVVSGVPERFEISYMPVTAFALGQVVTVTIEAADEDGNSMPATSASFTVTDGIDNNADGMPDDWSAYYAVNSPAADADGDGFTNGQEAVSGDDPAAYNFHPMAPDPFEDDDSAVRAAWLSMNGSSQSHTFHDLADEDWVEFYVNQSEIVNVRTSGLGTNADTRLTLYRGDATTPITPQSLTNTSNGSLLIWTVDETGLYYVRVTNYPPTTFGPDAGYTIAVTTDSGPSPGVGDVLITVESSSDRSRLGNATVTVNGQPLVNAGNGRYYQYDLDSGNTYTFTVTQCPGYTTPKSTSVKCRDNATEQATILLDPTGGEGEGEGEGGGCAGGTLDKIGTASGGPHSSAGNMALLTAVALVLYAMAGGKNIRRTSENYMRKP